MNPSNVSINVASMVARMDSAGSAFAKGTIVNDVAQVKIIGDDIFSPLQTGLHYQTRRWQQRARERGCGVQQVLKQSWWTWWTRGRATSELMRFHCLPFDRETQLWFRETMSRTKGPESPEHMSIEKTVGK